jgi:O-antigen/teichoic acid export membrane protein
MVEVGEQPATGRRRLAHAVGAVTGQGIQAAASLALQIVAARSLGLGEYGRYTIFLGLLIALSALLAGLRDAAIVLELQDHRLKAPANASQFVLAAIVGALGMAGAWWIASSSGLEAMLFAGVVSLWVLEEAGRRHLIGQLRFGGLVVNDLVYLAVSLGSLAFASTRGDLDVTTFLTCMAAGSAASFLLGVFVQLGPRTFSVAGTNLAGLKRVGSFAFWRSMQGITTPLQVLLLRVGVSAIASTVAVGTLEAGRLLIAPGIVVVAGLSTFLLPTFARLVDDNQAFYAFMRRVIAIQAVVMGAICLTVVAFHATLAELIVGDADAVDVTLVFSWVVMLAANVVSQPVGVAGIARSRTREVFVCRAIDAVIGLVIALVLADTAGVDYAPLGLAAGTVVGGFLVWRIVHVPIRRHDRALEAATAALT